jgi:hypothetical protein
MLVVHETSNYCGAEGFEWSQKIMKMADVIGIVILMLVLRYMTVSPPQSIGPPAS